MYIMTLEKDLEESSTSLSSFLSTLMEDDEITHVDLIVDNAKPDHNDSIRSLKLLEQEPKCRWNNLVRFDSDPDMFTSANSRSRKNQLNVKKSSLSGRRNSVPNVMLQIPKRLESPIPATIRPKKSLICSDSDLLRMPRRFPSPSRGKKSAGNQTTRNATWDTSRLASHTLKTNMFSGLLMEGTDSIPKMKSHIQMPQCLEDAISQDLISFRKPARNVNSTRATSGE
jgi:hypothetical protein